MSDYYRDRVRHGGILSDTFISICMVSVWRAMCLTCSGWWWNRQVVSNQYGLPGRAARNWGPDTLEGNLPADELAKNRRDQPVDTVDNKFRDEEYYKTKDFDLGDIEVPVLSVANWVCIIPYVELFEVSYIDRVASSSIFAETSSAICKLARSSNTLDVS